MEITPEQANQKDGNGRSHLLACILINQQKIDPKWWIPEHALDLDNRNWSPLCAMVHQRRLEEVPDLGEYFTKEDALGENGLHWCARWGLVQEAVFFLSKGANPTVKSKELETPMSISKVIRDNSVNTPGTKLAAQRIISLLERAIRSKLGKSLTSPVIEI